MVATALTWVGGRCVIVVAVDGLIVTGGWSLLCGRVIASSGQWSGGGRVVVVNDGGGPRCC